MLGGGGGQDLAHWHPGRGTGWRTDCGAGLGPLHWVVVLQRMRVVGLCRKIITPSNTKPFPQTNRRENHKKMRRNSWDKKKKRREAG